MQLWHVEVFGVELKNCNSNFRVHISNFPILLCVKTLLIEANNHRKRSLIPPKHKFKSSDSCIFRPSDLLILVSSDSSTWHASVHPCRLRCPQKEVSLRSERVGFSCYRARINFLSLLLEFDVVCFCNLDVNSKLMLLSTWE